MYAVNTLKVTVGKSIFEPPLIITFINDESYIYFYFLAIIYTYTKYKVHHFQMKETCTS